MKTRHADTVRLLCRALPSVDWCHDTFSHRYDRWYCVWYYHVWTAATAPCSQHPVVPTHAVPAMQPMMNSAVHLVLSSSKFDHITPLPSANHPANQCCNGRRTCSRSAATSSLPVSRTRLSTAGFRACLTASCHCSYLELSAVRATSRPHRLCQFSV